MANKNILLIDDDNELAELLNEYLTSEGFILHCCFDGRTGLQQAIDKTFDLILLDVMMPELTGFEVLKALGSQHQTPILMLTAKGDDEDRILGLELGADDYLAKPFKPRELLARINAILRRIEIVKHQRETTTSLFLNEIKLDHNKREASCVGNVVDLTGTEYQVLTCLMENNGQIVSKETLSETVLGRKLSPFDRSIDMHISNIRRKFLSFSKVEKIKTVRGSGYIFMTGMAG